MSETGPFMAMGAQSRKIFLIFISESVMLSVLGGALGVSFGMSAALSLIWVLQGVPVLVYADYLVMDLLVEMGAGLLAGVATARRAIRIDPVETLLSID